MKAQVINYHSNNNADFDLTIDGAGDREITLFLQPAIRDNVITSLTTIDSDDDAWILHPELHDEAIAAMQDALNEYLGRGAAKKYHGYHKDFASLDDAKHAIDVDDINTDGMIWNGECYYDRDEETEWWPVYEITNEEATEIIGFIKGY